MNTVHQSRGTRRAIDSPNELRQQWADFVRRLSTLHELEVEDFAEVCAMFGRMRRARMSIDDGAYALLGVLARQAFPFVDDGDTDTDGASESPIREVQNGAGVIGGHR